MAQRGPSLGLRIDEDLHNALKKLAGADDRTVSNYLERLLYDHVAQKGLKVKRPDGQRAARRPNKP